MTRSTTRRAPDLRLQTACAPVQAPSVEVPADVWEAAKACIGIVLSMKEAAATLAKDQPSPSGLYPVALISDAEGNPIMRDGRGVVVVPPVHVTGMKGDAVEFTSGDQLLSPKQAAAFTSLNKVTLWRAVQTGELPEPTKLEGRRVAHKLGDLMKWIGEKNSGQ